VGWAALLAKLPKPHPSWPLSATLFIAAPILIFGQFVFLEAITTAIQPNEVMTIESFTKARLTAPGAGALFLLVLLAVTFAGRHPKARIALTALATLWSLWLLCLQFPWAYIAWIW
jgi:hypothetical protein